MNNKIKVCAYARFSSNNQRAESITTQLDAIKRYCDLNNMEIVKTFIDEAKTATSDEREGFIQMIEESKLRKWSGVILYSLDRFSRNVANHYYYKSILDAYGIKLYAVVDGVDGTENAEVGLMTNIKVGLAEYYSAHLSRLILDACLMNSKNGLKSGGVDNYGFYTENSVYKINEEEAEVVRMMFNMVAEYKSISEIKDFINSKGYLTRFGNKFSTSSINYILRNRKYDGYMIYNQYRRKPKLTSKSNKKTLKPENEHVIIEDALPRIVEHELFLKVQKILDTYKTYKYKYGNNSHYLLNGIIHCSKCGGRFHHEKKKGGRNKTIRNLYTCCHYSVRRGNCTTKSINSDYMNSYILHLLDGILLSENSITILKDKILKLIKTYKIELEGWLRNAITEYEKTKKEVDRLTNVARQATGKAKESLLKAIELTITESLQKQKDIKVKSALIDSLEEPMFIDLNKIIDSYKIGKITEDYSKIREVILRLIENIMVSNDKIIIVFNYINLVTNYNIDLIETIEIERDAVARNRFLRG